MLLLFFLSLLFSILHPANFCLLGSTTTNRLCVSLFITTSSSQSRHNSVVMADLFLLRQHRSRITRDLTPFPSPHWSGGLSQEKSLVAAKYRRVFASDGEEKANGGKVTQHLQVLEVQEVKRG